MGMKPRIPQIRIPKDEVPKISKRLMENLTWCAYTAPNDLVESWELTINSKEARAILAAIGSGTGTRTQIVGVKDRCPTVGRSRRK